MVLSDTFIGSLTPSLLQECLAPSSSGGLTHSIKAALRAKYLPSKSTRGLVYLGGAVTCATWLIRKHELHSVPDLYWSLMLQS